MRIRVVAGLFERGTQVLVQQRPQHKTRGMLWEFPGGKVEAGETDRAALVRECAEELGVKDVEVGTLFFETEHAYPDLTVHLLIYRATLPSDATICPSDAHTLAWVERQELGALEFCAADRPFVAELSQR